MTRLIQPAGVEIAWAVRTPNATRSRITAEMHATSTARWLREYSYAFTLEVTNISENRIAPATGFCRYSAGFCRAAWWVGVRAGATLVNMRAEQVPAGFSVRGQIARTAALAALILAGALFLARGASPWAWLLLPGVWMFANFFEWTVHRFPMHRPLRPRVMFRN